jgi:hypothetical protein
VPALSCLALAAAIPSHVDAGLAASLRASWSGREGHVLLDMSVGTWPIVAGLGLLLAVAAAAATGALGGVDVARERLGRIGPVRRGSEVFVGLAIAGALMLAVHAVIAGAARGVDASAAGLTTLWIEWLRRVLLAAGVASLIGAVLEIVAMRGALRRALYQTREEVEEQAG